MTTQRAGVIVPVNTAEVLARILDLAERLEAKAATFPAGSLDRRGAEEGALAVRVVLQMLAETLTAAHQAAVQAGEPRS